MQNMYASTRNKPFECRKEKQSSFIVRIIRNVQKEMYVIMQTLASNLAVHTVATKMYRFKFAYLKNLHPSSEDLSSP